MKTLIEVIASGGVFDASGVDNPHDWHYTKVNGIWFPKSKIDFSKKSV